MTRAATTSASTPRSFSHVASAAHATARSQPRQTQSLKRSHQLSSRRACACAWSRKRRSRRRACPSSFCFSLFFFFLRAIVSATPRTLTSVHYRRPLRSFLCLSRDKRQTLTRRQKARGKRQKAKVKTKNSTALVNY